MYCILVWPPERQKAAVQSDHKPQSSTMARCILQATYCLSCATTKGKKTVFGIEQTPKNSPENPVNTRLFQHRVQSPRFHCCNFFNTHINVHTQHHCLNRKGGCRLSSVLHCRLPLLSPWCLEQGPGDTAAT